jgi:hypothetical protein
MTDRICALRVALERDLRPEDVQPIIDAIKMVRGVLDVTTNTANSEVWIGYQRARHELTQRLIDALND